MNNISLTLTVDIAQTQKDIRAAQRLRYEVFVKEMGADGPLVDHVERVERDSFDPYALHFILRDLARPEHEQVVGVYRVLSQSGAAAAGRFYCEDEYDLSLLTASGHRLLELGRSCLHPEYRNGPGLFILWSALADYVETQKIDLLFGVASFPGRDVAALAAPLSLLAARHLAPPELRVTAKAPGARPMDILPFEQIDQIAARRDTPSLIKAYLRLGGVIGEGAFLDDAFNTVDICLLLPTRGKTIPRAMRGLRARFG